MSTPLSDIKRVLVSRTDELCDVIVTLPLAVAIREQMPDVELGFMVRPYISHLVDRIREIDKTFTLQPSTSALPIFREFEPDAVIFAKPTFRLAIEGVRARIDVRIGSGYRWYSGLFTRWVYDRRKRGGNHEAEFELNMLGPLFHKKIDVRMPILPTMDSAAGEAGAHLESAGIRDPYVVIHPIGRPSVGTYPLDRFAAIGKGLLDARSDLSIVITSGHGEHPIAQRLKETIGAGDRVAIIDTLSPNGVSELLRRAACFVSVPSDGAHLAALVRSPVVALYPGLPPDWPIRRAPIGPQVTTLTPESDEPIPDTHRGQEKPDNIIARIRPERAIQACLRVLSSDGA